MLYFCGMNEAEYYFIDSHTHLYASQFDVDRVEVMQRCLDNNVRKLVMPNEDYLSIAPLKSMLNNNKGICYGAMGLHPTSVNDGYKHEMELIGEELFNGDTGYVAVGEIGMDLYWDKTYMDFQKTVLREQFSWALQLNLPVIIHSRSSESVVLDILDESEFQDVRGIFHCWSGTIDETIRAMRHENFYFGVGATCTYKKSKIPSFFDFLDLNRVVLETDSPYLPPVPYRGQRNESSYIPLIANKLSENLGVPVATVAGITNKNAEKIFGI